MPPRIRDSATPDVFSTISVGLFSEVDGRAPPRMRAPSQALKKTR
jgi:hypothetical protein